MTATAYTRFARTVERHAASLHPHELSVLRHAADAVFFSEEDRDEALTAARTLIETTLAHEDRLGPDAARRLLGQLDTIEPAAALA